MSDFLARVAELVRRGEVNVSRHGFRELSADDILLDDVIAGLNVAIPVEEYPNYGKAPCILVLQRDRANKPVHVLWGIPKDQTTPAVLITAYRPEPARWSADFTRRTKP